VREIEEAAARIAPYVRRTPTIELSPGVELKLEFLQVTGSFKPRGMFNKMLSSAVPDAGVVAASGGNAGLAVAYAAGRLGHRAEIFVPEGAPVVKVARIESYGALVHRAGATYADAAEASVAHAEATGAMTIHAYDQPEVVAGAGTIGLELPPVDTVLVAVGGGGLIAGIASWFAGRVRVVAVEPEGSPTLAAAVAAGRPVDVDAGGVASDSLGARRIGALAWEQVMLGHITGNVVLPGDAVLAARQELWSALRIAAEPGGAAALAALSSGAYVPSPGERVCVIVCGANASPADLA
jgi:threonine dehydratase